MDVSVCIVNWNTRELLRSCLRSLQACTRGLSWEVIVVDNHSSDGSARMVATEFPWVRLLARPDNTGFSRGSNLAATVARGDCLLYLNPDTELSGNALLAMWRYLRRHRDCGAVGCRLLNSDGSLQLTCACTYPTPRNELSTLLGLDRLFPRSAIFSAREMAYWDRAHSRDVDCLSGACMMVPRALAERLGGFDERLFMYAEDLDLCRRIQRSGLRLRYLATESIYHHEGAASRRKGRSFAPVRQRQANFYFLNKHFGRATGRAYRAAVALGTAVRAGLALLATPVTLLKPATWRQRWHDRMAVNGAVLMWALGLRR
ncbi:MAG: hypothetical protein RL227_549 [Pseudomonadota bacterium]|jgi:GT2 family glycosyltransferase